MKEANQFFNNLSSNIKKNVKVAMIAEVVKFYPEVMKVDVMPLPKEDSSIILNVPVVSVRCGDFFVYYPLKVSDKVVLLFLDNDIDNILLGEDSVQTERVHDLNDCICLGGITIFTESLKVSDTEALCLQNVENTANIVIKSSGDVSIKAKNFKVIADRIDLN